MYFEIKNLKLLYPSFSLLSLPVACSIMTTKTKQIHIIIKANDDDTEFFVVLIEEKMWDKETVFYSIQG